MEWHEQRTLLEAARSALNDLRSVTSSEIPFTDRNNATRDLKLQTFVIPCRLVHEYRSD